MSFPRTRWRLGVVAPAVLALWALLDLALRVTTPPWPPMSPTRLAERAPAPHAPYAAGFQRRTRRPMPGEGALGGNVKPGEWRPPYTFSTDEHGYRLNPEIDGRRYPDAVIVGGDSFVFGAHLDDRETFAAALTRRSGLAVYGLGRPWRNPLPVEDLDHLLGVWPARPRLAVLVHLEQHDRRDAVEAVPATAGGTGPIDRWQRLAEAWTSVSPLEDVARRAYRLLADDRVLPNPLRDNAAILPLPDGRRLVFRASELSPVKRGYDREAIEGAVGYMTRWSDVVRERGMRSVVLLLPTRYMIYAPLLEPSKARRDSIDVARRHHADLAAALRRAGHRVVNAAELFAQSAPRELETGEFTFWLEDNHWNARGVDLVARALSDTLAAMTGPSPSVPPRPAGVLLGAGRSDADER